MDLEIFLAIVLMQMLAATMGFDEDLLEIIRAEFYLYPEDCYGRFISFKKYLGAMELRNSQTIPCEIIKEFYPGNHKFDVHMKGNLYIYCHIFYYYKY